ncbi:MAG: hypothetical protein HY664_01280 [Chloroflexi bacterium]|nr:hypothetical protein [Chloroflexota bacterium]
MTSPALDRRLKEIYHLLEEHYGPQHWWPAETPFEVIVGAILTQSAAWSNVEKAIVNLKAQVALTSATLRHLPSPELAQLIYPSGYYNAKAIKLKAFVDWLEANYGGDLDSLLSLEQTSLRQKLLSIHGIGAETADSIILYAAHKPIFVIDAYTRRILQRLGLKPNEENYASYQAFLMEHLPHDPTLFNEYHALLVRHGKDTCRRKPLCQQCCLLYLCPTGSQYLST